jgi:hypothetical protein
LIVLGGLFDKGSSHCFTDPYVSLKESPGFGKDKFWQINSELLKLFVFRLYFKSALKKFDIYPSLSAISGILEVTILFLEFVCSNGDRA